MNSRFFILFLCPIITACITSTPHGKAASARTPVVHKQKLELPSISSSDDVIVHTGYTVSYNTKRKIPNWVAYELTPKEANGTTSRPKNSPFREDPDFRGPQPSRSDYSNSQNWDKGHLAPCADMKISSTTMIESFYLTNVCPQNHSINAGDWQKLEELVHNMAAKSGKTMYIVCGPIVSEGQFGTLGAAGITIPDSFFKALLYKDANGYHSIAFIMPNKPSSRCLGDYSLTVNDLEKIIGVDLFTNLDERIQESVEGQHILNDWNIKTTWQNGEKEK